MRSPHSIPGVIEFKEGNGGLTKLVITTPFATAEMYLHGAHVTHYKKIDQSPVLFLSSKSKFERGKAIRGGIPICLPWFGNLAGNPDAPAHGFARTSEWSVQSTIKNADGSATVVLSFVCDETASPWWPYAMAVTYTVTVSKTLKLDLKISNTGKQVFTFEEALHSYFHVGDVQQVGVAGLGNTHYLDKLQANRQLEQGADPIQIVGETDRIYLDTTGACEITDPKLKRKIVVSKQGSNNTVLWNPWIAKAKAMGDFGDDEWPNMLCIETCNIGKSAAKLDPGQSHIMTAEIETAPNS